MTAARVERIPGSFEHDGHRLVYDVIGDGERVVVLTHGLLMSRKMHRPLSRRLAERGYRAVSLDFLGHGESDRPTEMTAYSMQEFGREIVALLDHLGVEQAVVQGTSLGANSALEAAVAAPERIRGMVIEMPVLDNAILGAGAAFLPFMLAMRFAAPVLRALNAAANLVPTSRLPAIDMLMDWPRDPPAPSLAVLRGLFFGRIGPPTEVRRTITIPALILGHPNDPIHPFTDSDALARELPNGRLVEAESVVEMRLRPERLTAEIAAFVDECWERRVRTRARSDQRARVA
jgi:pimeloyl-ACP methyl ester carboxylesterase